MTAGLSLIGDMAMTPAFPQPRQSIPSSWSERMDAAWKSVQTGDRYWNQQDAFRTETQKVIDDLRKYNGEVALNPFDRTVTRQEINENPGLGASAILAKRLQTLREKTAKARAELPGDVGVPPDFLDVDGIQRRVGMQSGQARAEAEKLEDTGNGLAAFIAHSGAEMATPHGVASMFLPVSRLPFAAAEATVAGFARNVGKEAALQAFASAGLQVPASLLDYYAREATGTQPTTGEIVGDVVGAGAGGAVFGGAFRAAHLGLIKAFGKGAPRAVKDAELAIRSREQTDGTNVLGMRAGVHEANIDRATIDVAHARPVQVEGEAELERLVRVQNPDLMARYDAAQDWLKDSRMVLQPTDESIAILKTRMDEAAARITGIEATGPQAEALGQSARMAREMYEAAVARKAAMATGEAADTTLTQSLRTQAVHADLEMREMLDEVRQAYRQAANSIAEKVEPAAIPTSAKQDAPRLTPDEQARITELRDNIEGYREQLAKAANPEDQMAWARAIDTAGAEIDRILDLDNQPALAALAKRLERPTDGTTTTFVPPPEQKGAGRPAGEEAQAKVMDKQVRDLVGEEGFATAEQKAAFERIAQEEKEANTALACVGGAI